MSRKNIAWLPMTSLLAGLSALASPATAADQAPPDTSFLPEGEGKVLVESFCIACHNPNYILESGGYNREHWEQLVLSMMPLDGTPQLETITDYLATHFPPTGERAPNLIAGPIEATFENWKVPTLGQMSRDPVEAPDGSIWWVGQWASGNLVGRLDPVTGDMKEYPLPPRTLPHSVTPDTEGNMWVSGNGNATIIKLDPVTEEMTVYPMPDPAARDPHTMVFDSQGILWFTVQFGNMIGTLDPATGDIKLVTAPVPESRPYAIKIAPDGNLWVNCRNSPCVYEVDHETMEVTPYTLPHADTWSRRLAVTSDGMVWYGDTEHGKIGRVNPATGEVTEWDSPSGPDSVIYFMEVIDDKIYYNESGKRPETLVRFDPETEIFQSWAIPSAQGFYGAIARHGRVTRNGDLLLHQGSSNNIMRIHFSDNPND